MIEEKIIIGKGGKYPLNGILSLPDNCASKVPAVVLVHGSGSHDMDETIFSNKPFRDIGEYLPQKGIAVLRYDKRTKIYGKQMVKEKNFNSFTIKEEVIEDALFAANFLKNDNRINQNHIYILGHSMGGMLAPRIDSEGGNFAGLIFLAGSPRNIIDIMISQNEEMIPQLGKFLQLIVKKQFASFKKKFDAMNNMTEEEAKKTKFVGNNYMWYLKEMTDHPCEKYLKKINKPVLILQGDKDFQVTTKNDLELYKKICEGMQNVSFKLYPDLNHLFVKSIYGKIKDVKKEYMVPQKVDAAVLNDIAEFILNNN